MSKLKKKSTKSTMPFDMSSHKTERTGAAILMHWMRNILEEKNIDLGFPDVETSSADGKMPDFLICETRKSDKALCVIEAKLPGYDIFNFDELKEPARKKATRRKAKYFAVTNFQQLIWYKTKEANEDAPEEEQIADKYALSKIENLDDIEQTRFSEPIKRALEGFLTELHLVNTGKKQEPKLAVDEFLVYRLHEKIKTLTKYYKSTIYDKCHKDKLFAKSLNKWFFDQGWSFAWLNNDFDKAARQTAYLLVNKILFYDLLQAKRPAELDPLEVHDSLTKGSMLQHSLQGYFNEVLKIDYETIYTTDFIDSIAFPDDRAVVGEIKELVGVLKRYDFSTLGYDIIGRIFERLIPAEERHNFGQYFTPPDVVDLILGFCLKHEDDKVIDPSCGAGTFLVRAYQNKKIMNQMKEHEDILNTLWGCDIAKFPAHLSTINLAINDLGSDNNYPNILSCDFFSLLSGVEGFNPENWRKSRAKTLGLKERDIVHPRWFDAIVGNPPYTRQEEIKNIATEDDGYKKKMIENAVMFDNKKIAGIGKRAGIHAYFFIHGAKFLKDGGRFGFIVSNSWMDADYGKGLQEFFLKNFRIVAIIESKVERWFEEADINTGIIILQKCGAKAERDANLVRFVHLKKPLRDLIPPAQNMWEKQVARLEAIKAINKTVLAHSDLYENEEMRIFPKSQKDLWGEGFDKNKYKYVGSKWGKYVRAPKIFFDIMDKVKDQLVPLSQVANICRGFTTGADPWFYVADITDQTEPKTIQHIFQTSGYKGKLSDLRLIQSGDGTKWLVENKYIFPVVRNPDKYSGIFIDVNEVKDFVVIITETRKNLRGSLIEKYIKHGEVKKYKMGKNREAFPAETGTCVSRKYWYILPEITPSRILWQKAFYTSFRHNLANEDVFANQRFYHIVPFEENDLETVAASLNSILIPFTLEVQRAAMGLGAGEATVEEASQIMLVSPKALQASTKRKLRKALNVLGKREIGPIFDELGAASPEEAALEKVRPDRRELDNIIMGDILGLSDVAQLNVYRAVIDMVKSRIERADSVDNHSASSEGINIDMISKTVVETIDKE